MHIALLSALLVVTTYATPPYGPPCTPGDTSCLEYEHRRATLVAADEKGSFVHVELSAQERKIDAMLNDLREQDVKTFGPARLPYTMNFREARPLVDSASKVLPLLQKMPKGAVLHSHGFGNVEVLIANGTYDERCYINTVDTPENPVGVFYFSSTPPAPVNGAVWKQVTALRHDSGNATEFDAKLLSSMQFFTPGSEVSEDDMWVTFDTVIHRFSSLRSFLPVFREFTTKGLLALHIDGIQHLELRGIEYIYDETGRVLTSMEVIDEYLSLVAAFNKAHGADMSLLWIYMGSKAENATSVLDDLHAAVALRRTHSNVVVGFDLVDEEDRFHRFIYYRDDFLAIEKFIQENGDQPLPYFFHAGETTWMEREHSNLYEAYLFNCSRVGHGYALDNYPLLLELFKKSEISLEVCPISNQLLRLLDNLQIHPAVRFMAAGLPIHLSPDDPVIYGYEGVTYDFYMAYMGWNLDLAHLKQLAVNSIVYSAASPQRKVTLLTAFHKRWDLWIDGLSNSR